MTVGIEGGYQKHWHQKPTHFEIIAGKSFSKTQASKRFGFVQRCACVLLLCLGFNQVINADNHIRDYYQEPGTTPYRAETGYTDYESIDPFSGILRLNVVDVSLPGNGGLDMNVSRHYKHPQGGWQFRPHSQVGRGWSMHPGRLVYSESGTLVDDMVIELCDKIDPAINGWDGLQTHERLNPAFETSDGVRHHFYRDRLTNNTSYISKENWRLHCEGNNYVVTSPDGVRYYPTQLSQKVHSPDTFGTTSWYVTRIEDVHNNVIDIDYIQAYENVLNLRSPWAHHFVMNSMSSNDGRRIRFNYMDIGTLQARLQSIQILNNGGAPVKTWQYNYDLFQFTSQPSSSDRYVLTSVVQPDGTQWEMEHFPRDFAGAPTTYRMAGSIWKVSNPLGGQSCYYFDWTIVYEDINIVSSDTDSLIWKVQNKNRNQSDCFQADPVANKYASPTNSGALWRYRYNREINNNYDVTMIEKPDGSGEVYRYRARFPVSTAIGNYWTRAQLVEKVDAETLDVFSNTYTPTWVTLYSYVPRQLTDTDWLLTDLNTRQTEYGISPMLVEERTIYLGRTTPIANLDSAFGGEDPTRYKANIRTQSDFDDYGNPGLVFEGYGTGDYWLNSTSFTAQFARSTRYTYTNLTDIWKLGLPASTTVDNVLFPNDIINLEPITNVYDPANGNLLSKSEHGITTDYTYHADGELSTVTDARGLRTTYSDYYRGVPRTTQYANFTQTQATVSDFGEVLTATDARGFTTTYEYDPLSRITGITLPNPTSLPVQINYVFSPGNNQTIIDRGNYRGTTVKDGFGQVISTTHEDITDANSVISQTMEYDVFKRKTFDSLPNSPDGTRYTYDFLGRVIKVENPDSTSITTVYDDNTGNRVDVTDELLRTISYEYQSFGSPSDKQLIRILSPENIQTSIYRDRLGRNLGIWQGQTGGQGTERTFTYNANNQLETETNPESGITTYLYDAVGNISSKQIGSNTATTYTYDNLNRTELITYPGTTPSVTYRYDGNNNITQVVNSNSTRTYGYDQNNNLTSENINIDNQTNVVQYSYDPLDNLLTTTYPSFRVVDYSPDVFGRPTQATPFINSLYYYPSGQLDQIAYANGVVTDFTLDNRLRVQNISTVGLTPIADLVYDYDLVSNVTSIQNMIPSESQYSRTMTYDRVNRLTNATGIWGTATYNYDAIGNIQQKTIGTDTYGYTYNSTTNRLNNLTLNNQPNSAYTYDTYGNISGVTGQRNMLFNDAQQLIQATILDPQDSQTIINTLDFDYDGNNMRVSRNEGTETINYVYSTSGNLLAENNSDPTQNLEHFYLGSKRVASVRGRPSPVAAAGPDQIVTEGALVTLDGSASTAPNGYTYSYRWYQITGRTENELVIYDSTTSTANFTLPSGVYFGDGQTFTFRLIITSSNGEESQDDVIVSVQLVDTDTDGISDIWEQQYYPDVTMYDGNSDPDQDGYTNADEYRLGLDPTVAQPLEVTIGLIVKPGVGQSIVYWKNTERALNYDIYWSNSPNVTPQTGTLIQNVTSPYIHTGLSNGQPYYYIVVANNLSSSSTSVEQVTRLDSRYWGAPTKVTASYRYRTAGYQFKMKRLSPNSSEVHYFYTKSEQRNYLLPNYSHYGFDVDIWLSSFNETTGWADDVLLDQTISSRDFMYYANQTTGNAVLTYNTLEVVDNNTVTKRRFMFFDASSGWSRLPALDYPQDPYQEVVGVSVNDNDEMTLVWKISAPDDYQTISSISSQTFNRTNGWSPINDLVNTENTGNQIGLGTVSIDASISNNILLTWGEHDQINNTASINMIFYSPQNGWTAPQQVEEIDTTNYGSILSNITSTLTSTGAIVVWNRGPHTDGLYSRTYNINLGWSEIEYIDEDEDGQFKAEDVIQTNDGTIYLLTTDAAADAHALPSRILTKRINSPFEINETDVVFGETRESVRGTYLFSNHNRVHYIGYPRDYSTNSVNGYASDYSFSSNGVSNSVILPRLGSDCWLNANTNYSSTVGEYSEYYKSDINNTIVYRNCEYDPYEFVMSTYWSPAGVPNSDAGVDRNIAIGDTVILDARDSTDDGSIVDYSWQQVSGPTVTPNSFSGQTIEFIADQHTFLDDYNYTDPVIFELTVTDDQGMLDKDIVRIQVLAFEPVANAGPSQTINMVTNPTTTIMLDGSASYDPNGSIVEYRWEQNLSGNPPLATINDPTSVTPTVTLPVVTNDTRLYFTLTVTDNHGVSSSSFMSVDIITNESMTINAGVDQVVRVGDTVQLLGNVSDPSGVLRPTNPYSWRTSSGPVAVQFSDTTITNPTFVAPNVAKGTVFELTLTARDINNYSFTDTVRVIVQDVAETDLGLPVVTPPSSLNVEATAVLTPVTLGVAAANDPEDGALTATPNNTGPFAVGVHTIIWSATDAAGNTGVAYQTVTIQDTTPPVLTLPPDVVVEGTGLMPVVIGQATATDIFTTYMSSTAPSLYPIGTIRVRWTATDANGNTTSAFQNVTVSDPTLNQPPIANAGNDQTVVEGNVVTLSAAASNDPNGSIVSYQWQQTSGPVVVLNNANTTTPSFTAPNVFADTNLSFSLVVTDDQGATASDSVLVTVQYSQPTVDAGPDQVVASNALVSLTATVLNDPGGSIVSYQWSNPSDVTLDNVTSATPSFTAPNVVSDAVLSFTVQGLNSSGAVVDSDIINVAVQLTVSSQTTITDLYIRCKVTTCNLVWTPLAGAQNYDVYRSTTQGGPYALIAQGNEYAVNVDTDLTLGVTYYYVVRGVSDGIESADSNEVSVTPTSQRSR